MLLLSYANWDELFQVCLGLCDEYLPLNPDEVTGPPTNETTVMLDKGPERPEVA
jgi:hypothetical protein